jgi:hypothetical protein
MKVKDNFKKLVIIAGSALMMLSLGIAMAQAGLVGADSPPSIPNQFYGTVKNNGAVVSSGYTVAAKVGATQLASTVTDSGGRYGYGSGFYISITDGETIEFWVNGVKTLQTITSSAGSAIEVDLTVTGAGVSPLPTTPAPTTATPTTTPAINYPVSTTSTQSSSGTAAATDAGAPENGGGSNGSAPAQVNTTNAGSQVEQQQPNLPVQNQQGPVKESDSKEGSPGSIIIIGVCLLIVLIIIIRILVMRSRGPHYYR